ncbi:hypothetical protein NT6N_18560 [Oceaniferula spumae]|uniref:Uncharacterized protein n=1 Tax=Oceaniferula spumae TaxID=2979115 RepID=A0AAT9FLF9_9BACT
MDFHPLCPRSVSFFILLPVLLFSWAYADTHEADVIIYGGTSDAVMAGVQTASPWNAASTTKKTSNQDLLADKQRLVHVSKKKK